MTEELTGLPQDTLAAWEGPVPRTWREATTAMLGSYNEDLPQPLGNPAAEQPKCAA